MAEGRESFECGPSVRIDAQERVSALQFAQLNAQLGKIEVMMERLERRLWLTVYSMVGVVLAQAFQSILTVGP